MYTAYQHGESQYDAVPSVVQVHFVTWQSQLLMKYVPQSQLECLGLRERERERRRERVCVGVCVCVNVCMKERAVRSGEMVS